ncbi:nucleoprotein TPR-like [Odontomachus brunneus]|uniref:nucleoprotein TPR-like n=1 Tax=Odontomachus brunneus TaxID=486640 RepID=UPI0013F22EDC|nr:nucleoprotein TPR-like [Odontomachus brunneus]
MKKRRPWARNYSTPQRHSCTYERLQTREKRIFNLKRRGSRWSNPKLQENNGQFDNDSRLKKDAFGSLESLFDIRKPLNLLDVYQIAFDYCNDKSVERKSIDAFDAIKSEPLVETLFLQSLLPSVNSEPRVNEPIHFEGKENIKVTELKASERSHTETSDFARKLQQNTSIYNKENYTVNMATVLQEGEIPKEQQEEVEEKAEEKVEEEKGEEKEEEKEEEKKEEKEKEKEDVAGALEESKDIKDEDSQKKLPSSVVSDILDLMDININNTRLKVEIERLQREIDHLKTKHDQPGVDAQLQAEKKALERKEIIFKTSTSTFCKKMEEILDIPYDELFERYATFFTKRIEEEVEEEVEFPQIEYPEDKLPRIIICGRKENMFPQIVIADSKQIETGERYKRLVSQGREAMKKSQKLVFEDITQEWSKYKLEKALLEKDKTIEKLDRTIYKLKAEMHMIVRENKKLRDEIATLSEDPYREISPYPSPQRELWSDDPTGSPRLTGGGSATDTPNLEYNILQNVKMCTRSVILTKASLPQETCSLEQQLGSMESDVRNMQMQLANVRREQQQLKQQRNLLKCTGPCASCACSPLPATCVTVSALKSISSKGSTIPAVSPTKMIAQAVSPKCTSPCTNIPMGTSTCAQQQLRDLREQYARLQEDYKNKLYEVSCMRTDAEKMKQDLRDAKEEKERVEIKMIDVQERLRFLEEERGNFEGHKEQLVEQEQALIVAKQRVRETQDELEEFRSTTQDLSVQLEDYRNKYLQAQQYVEEQRRQMDLMEMDNARMNENVTLEIGRVKNQFQEKLAELAPLPEILKQSQTKLQETQQIRLIAERNCEDLSRELQGYKDKLQIQQNEVEVLRAQYQTLLDERGQGTGRFEEIEKKCGELRNENERMKNTLTRLEEQKAQLQKRMDEKMHENAQLLSQLDQVREESARQVARTKDRCENMRCSMQRQIAEMERELAQCRATARAAQRDRDEIRQKMQGQINNLNEAFEQAQRRIRSLQGHVNYLKTSYSNMLIDQREKTPTSIPAGDAPGLGYDSCDCNY